MENAGLLTGVSQKNEKKFSLSQVFS